MLLVLGKQHPIKTPQDGCIAEFFSANSNELIISLSDLSEIETKTYSVGKIFVGLHSKDGLMILFFKWVAGNNHFLSACAVNTLRQESHQAVDDIINNYKQGERFCIGQTLVERTTNVIKDLRVFTLPVELSYPILMCLKQQSKLAKNNPQNKELLDRSFVQLILQHKTDSDLLASLNVDLYPIGN